MQFPGSDAIIDNAIPYYSGKETKHMSRTRATIPYAMLHGALWALFAVISSYSSNFLYHYGFSDGQISLLLGAAMALAFVLSIGAAEAISRVPFIRTDRVMVLFGVLLMLCACGMMLWQNRAWAAVTCFTVSFLLLQTFPALANSLGMNAIEKGAPTVYGAARGTGSLANSVTAYAVGLLVGRRGISILPVFTVGLTVVFLLGVVLYHRLVECGGYGPEKAPSAETAQREKGFLKKYPRFVLLMIGATLLCYSHNMISNFLLQVVTEKGGGPADQGAAAAAAAVSELPVMFLFPLMLKKWPGGRWMRLSVVFFAVKAAIAYFARTPEGVVLAQATQMLGFGLFNISSVAYAAEMVGSGEAVRAQSYLASTLTLGNLIAMSTGGVICQYFGVQVMLAAVGIMAVLGGIFLAAEPLVARRPAQPLQQERENNP